MWGGIKMPQFDDFAYALLPNILADLFVKPYSKIGEGEPFQFPTTGNNNQQEEESTTETQPSMPINTGRLIRNGDGGRDGLSGFGGNLTNEPDRHYAYEEDYWGGPPPSSLQQGLFGNMKAAFQEGAPYLGAFGAAMGIPGMGLLAKKSGNTTAGLLATALTAATTPLAPLAMLGAGLFGFDNPFDSAIHQQGLMETFDRVKEINPEVVSVYGKTPEEFGDFINGIFNKEVSNFDLHAANKKAWEGITPQAKQLFDMVGLEATPERLLDLRTNAMDTVRSIAMDLNSYVDPSLIGFRDLQHLNKLDWTVELAPYDVAKINDLANYAGVPATNIAYAYAQNPDWTAMKLAKGSDGIKDVVKSNVNLGYYDASQKLTEAYKTGQIDWNTWGQTQLSLKEQRDRAIEAINNGTMPGWENPVTGKVDMKGFLDATSNKATKSTSKSSRSGSGDGGSSRGRSNPSRGISESHGYGYGGGSTNVGYGGGDMDRF